MPQPPQHQFRSSAGRKDDKSEDAIKKLYDHVHDLHRALHGQLDHMVGRGSGTDTGGSTTESLGLTVKPQVVAQCYNTLGWYDAMGVPTSRNALLEFFNPGNAGVAWEATVSLDTIDLTASPFARTEKFSVEIRGIYHASVEGVHFFGLDVDGTAELLINGTVVCARYTSGPPAGNLITTTGSLPLSVGYHNLVVRWVAGAPGPNAGIKVGVQKPGETTPVAIPAADLGHYSGGLEAGAPTQVPVPQPPTTVPTGSTSFITTLPWTYTQPAPSGSEKLADGFILYFEEGVTGTPTKNQQKLAVTALSYNFTWPKNRQTSYAIATYRKTENGEEVGPKQTIASWQGIVSTAPILIADPATNPTAPSGTMDVGNGGAQNVNSGGASNIQTGGNFNVLAGGNANILTGGDFNVLTGGDFNVASGGNASILSGGNFNVLAGGAVTIVGATVTIGSGGQILITGGKIRLESPNPIEIKAMQTAPAEIRFLDAGNATRARFTSFAAGNQATDLQLAGGGDATGQLILGGPSEFFRAVLAGVSSAELIAGRALLNTGHVRLVGTGTSNYLELDQFTAVRVAGAFLVSGATGPSGTPLLALRVENMTGTLLGFLPLYPSFS